MPRIYPFRAWRYNPSAVRLDDVVTQPYDKISPAMQQAYYQRSPYNLIRIILGLPELFDAERRESVYTRAARDFVAWREQGVLHQEKDPCIFAYAQRFTVPGAENGPRPQNESKNDYGSTPENGLGHETIKERRGFIALGKLHEYADKVVFRHEQPLSQPKSDRLNLLNATHAHFGQIFMLYSDPAGSIERILYDSSGPAEAEVTDEYGVLHRLWKVSDPAAIRLLAAAMADKKLIIADGHHCYETALAYARENFSSTLTSTELTPTGHNPTGHNPTDLPHPPYPAAAAMMTFVNMDSDGIVILPIHRVVHSLNAFDPVAFAMAAKEFFTVDALAADAPSSYTELLSREQGTAFVAVTRAGALLLRSKPEAVAAALANQPERLRNLDLTQLHSILLERLLGLDAEKVREQANLRYPHDAAEAVDQIRRGEADVSFLTNPVSMEQLREVAFAGDTMPQKSTDFFPKLLSGLAIYALD